MQHRLPALDWMRGIAMVVMASDHANEAFNPARPATDSAYFYDAAVALDPLEFGVRWLSHICAPVFLFLAGTSLALSITRKLERGASSASIDRDLLVRGLLILAVDLTFINIVWLQGMFLLQVMTAIGVSMLLMIPLRRLPTGALVIAALAVLAGGEVLRPEPFLRGDSIGEWLHALFLSAGLFGLDTATGAPLGDRMPLLVAYPVLPWTAMMALGWVLGRWLLTASGQPDAGRRASRLLLAVGTASLALFAVIRGLGGYGDLGLSRLDDSWVQWLHVSKYPPSLAYTALELGLMAVLLAGLFRIAEAQGEHVRRNGPLLVFGQTAFFFYIAHIALFEITGRLLGVYGGADLTEVQLAGHVGLQRTTLAWALGLVLLYPLCLWYRRLKAGHSRSVLRYF